MTRCGRNGLRLAEHGIDHLAGELFAGDHAHQGVWVFAWGGRLHPPPSLPPSLPQPVIKPESKPRWFIFLLLGC